MRTLSIVTFGMLMALFFTSEEAMAGGDHGGQPTHQDAPASTPSNELTHAWSALLDACDGIAGDVEAVRLDGIHEKAGRIPGLAQALMPLTEDLDDFKRDRVKSGVTQLSKVAEHLQKVASTGDTKLLSGDLKRFDRALQLISAQYSEGGLPLSAQSSTGHGNSHHD